MSKFQGFEEPKENWSKLPHQLIDALPEIKTIGEMKVVLYVLRHTWGYRDEYKRITMDEFENGRKRKDGTRLDSGTGLSKPTIRAGIKSAVEDGFLFVSTDITDPGRVKKLYSLAEYGGKKLYPRGKETLPRTEKETIKKETTNMPQGGAGDFSDLFPEPLQADSTIRKLDDNGQAHLLTFGVLPSDETDSKEHAVKQELLSAAWQIHSPDVELAIVYFVLAVRAYHPDFAIPNDNGTRKDWYKSVAGHLKNYLLYELQNLYKLAIIKMIDKDLSYWRPGSLTNWAILEVANEPVLTHQGPQITDEEKAARDYLDSLEGKPLPD